MANFTVHSSTVTNNGTYTANGTFANPTNLAMPITWYGQISDHQRRCLDRVPTDKSAASLRPRECRLL